MGLERWRRRRQRRPTAGIGGGRALPGDRYAASQRCSFPCQHDSIAMAEVLQLTSFPSERDRHAPPLS
uniref:Uncharacterized protein n=1 Tax=Setaria italica TaxID=4555 RepID=K3YXF9_SETIT